MAGKKSFILIAFMALTLTISAQFRVGQQVPDIVMENLEGEEIKLSSYKGKVVLIDFWASWCAPCRKENPTLIKAYEKYKDAEFKKGSGFVVFSVSLDKNKRMWEKAIESDKLEEFVHVSDLKGWKSAAAVDYGIKAIPTSYLIDENGVVIASNLRGKTLESKLKGLRKGAFFWESWF